jgi:multiple sugar transport system substrate-binding protein
LNINRINLYFLLIVIVVMLNACTSNNSKDLPILHDNIRIGYFSEENFKSRYTSLINNDIDMMNERYTIVPTSELIKGRIDVKAWSKENEFDIIYIPGPLLEQFVEQDVLKNLDNLIITDELASDNFNTAFLELSKLYGQGGVYGLPPGIDGKAVVYNKNLFAKYKVDFPVNRMQWFDLIHLASRFPSAGLTITSDSGFELIWDVGHTNDYKVYRKSPPMVNFNSDPWREIWEKVTEPLAKRAILTNEYLLDSFLEGEAAMALISNRQYVELQKKRPDFEWGMVTMPVNSNQSDVTKYMHADGFYGISSSSPNQEAAVEWLKFFLSEKTLASDGMLGNFGLNTRKSTISDPFAEAVFKLHPVKRDVLPFEYLELGENSLQKLLSNNSTVIETLSELQDKAEEILRNTK